MRDNTIILLGIDELGDEFHAGEYKIPYAPGELSDDEIAIIERMLVHRAGFNDEIQGYRIIANYKTKDDYQREEADYNRRYEEYFNECVKMYPDDDPDEYATEMLQSDHYADCFGWWF